MSKFKSPGQKARDDAARHSINEPAWVEKKKRTKNGRSLWHEQWVINRDGVEVKKIPYREPTIITREETMFRETKARRDWQYSHKVNRHITGKAGEQVQYNPKSTRALTDEEAIICRIERSATSVRKLAITFGVSERCVERCINGDTYKHLNKIAKPRF